MLMRRLRCCVPILASMFCGLATCSAWVGHGAYAWFDCLTHRSVVTCEWHSCVDKLMSMYRWFYSNLCDVSDLLGTLAALAVFYLVQANFFQFFAVFFLGSC